MTVRAFRKMMQGVPPDSEIAVAFQGERGWLSERHSELGIIELNDEKVVVITVCQILPDIDRSEGGEG